MEVSVRDKYEQLAKTMNKSDSELKGVYDKAATLLGALSPQLAEQLKGFFPQESNVEYLK